ncbi:MAG TPA: alpha/beta hydrolase-fold protein [Candidatus Limnocylindria bacterium]|nr:alpha/beta hydrolase-fold protein [Candidatus Limnocylindria bacterium]
MKKLLVFALAASLFMGIASASAMGPAPLTVTVSVPEGFEGELNGRVLFMFDKEMPEDGMVIGNLDVTGCPVFGKTVFGLKAGDSVTLGADDPDVYGWPMQMNEIPAMEVAAQVLFVKYTQFTRSDGSVVWGMADHGGGGSVTNNPFNLYSEAKVVDLGGGALSFTLDQETPLGYELQDGQVTQQGNWEDKELVKYVKVKSELLSEFWGTDMYLGANVLLPKGYDAAKQYPVLYYQGHWPGGNAPLNYGRTGRAAYDEFNAFWDGGEAPQMIVVTFRDANMFYDTSYSVNSANLGPWGDAIMTELIPFVEEEFGVIREPWARALAGGSTGGWEALAMQVFNPDFFGGTWPMCPDAVDFNYHQIVNIYEDDNAYFLDNGWYKVERPSSRAVDGNIRWTIQDECLWEAAVGGVEHAVSLGQWAIWESVYGPQGGDGYPARIWDPLTGDIDHEVAAYWKENYDLNAILQANWATLGPKLVGKIHLRGGDMDNYYLNLAQYRMGDWLATTTEPFYAGYSVTFPRMGHTGNITNPDLLKEIAAHMVQYGPENAAEILGVTAE